MSSVAQKPRHEGRAPDEVRWWPETDLNRRHGNFQFARKCRSAPMTRVSSTAALPRHEP